MTEQPSDTPVPVFSFMGNAAQHPRQLPCWITHTNIHTHDIIRSGLDRSPLFSGVIEGVGPRYCPSIEDKVVRFSTKESHQIFLEPEGLTTHEVYPNGISTSLPFDIQIKLVRSIRGLEKAHITRPGYAIEYDYFDPRGLKSSLETKAIEGLFFAGQVNGTTGYEEAAAQGLLAGINAALKTQDRDAWCPRRDEAYLGVLVDDLITRGVTEPYRMFTSRAEYRLQLREDNADLRLTEIGRRLGVVDDARWAAFEAKRKAIVQEQDRLQAVWFGPNTSSNTLPEADALRVLGKTIERDCSLHELLRRPDISYASLMTLPGAGEGVHDPLVAEQVEIQAKYQGYIKRQKDEVARNIHYEETRLPQDLDYTTLSGLSSEVQQKLNQYKPETAGQAARISGITPAAVSLLLVHVKRGFSSQKKRKCMNLATQLANGIAVLGFPLPDETQLQLLQYLALISRWTRVHNLTAVREPETMLTRHLLDSLAVLPYIAGPHYNRRWQWRWFAGIPLALAHPDWQVALSKAIIKKPPFCSRRVSN